MKNKKVWIGILALIVFIALALFYLNYRNRTLSPPGNAELNSAGMTVKVTYSRPSVRGRVIFGTQEQGALQPYGQYWRLGANEATEITVNRDVLFNNVPLKAGTYRMFAFPEADAFEIGLNSELGKWGAMEPDYKKDIFRTKVPVEKTSSPVEQYTISLSPAGDGINMVFEWATTRFTVPIKPQ